MITASEFHPKECNLFVYSSSKVLVLLLLPAITSCCYFLILLLPTSSYYFLLIPTTSFPRAQFVCVTCGSPPSVTPTPRCSRSRRTQPTDPSSRRSSLPSRTSSSPILAVTWFPGGVDVPDNCPFSDYRDSQWTSAWSPISGITFQSRSGTSTWSRSRSRRSQSTSISAPSSVLCTRMTASLISLRWVHLW